MEIFLSEREESACNTQDQRERPDSRVSGLWSVLRGSLLLPGDDGSEAGHEAGLASTGRAEARQTLTLSPLTSHLSISAEIQINEQ